MKTPKIWGITNKRNATLAPTANTTASSYQLVEYKTFRKFSTRADARAYKQSLRNPQHYAIVNTTTGVAVR